MTKRDSIKFALIFLILSWATNTSQAKEWRGIIPGVSVRSDVVKFLQRCADSAANCEFDVNGDRVRIVFSGTVQDYFYPCAGTISRDTVLAIEVTPRTPTPLKNLRRSHHLKKL